jgi:hypothetical protein
MALTGAVSHSKNGDVMKIAELARKPVTWIASGVLAVAAVAALLVFQPWKLVVNDTVDEAAPVAAKPAPSESAPAGPLATGTLIAHEHDTSGTLRILDLGGGRRALRLDDLDTSNGPDLHVWLTDAEVKPGRDGWGVFDDGKYLDLGKLKGNRGSQNYEIPASADLAAYRSVTIWCDRFNVSFGAATLQLT